MGTTQELEKVYVDGKVAAYLDAIIAATRAPESAGIRQLAGVLAAGALDGDRERILQSARQRALHAGRKYVVPDDVRAAALDALSLTLELTDGPAASELGVEGAVQAILDWVEVP